MYRASVLLLMLILPAASIYAEHSYLQSSAPLMELVGKWFVFWSAGVRLLLAGLSQFFRPRFTSEGIFGMESDDPLPFVQAANFATGFVGVASLAKPSFVLPVAIIAGIFYGIAGIRHLLNGGKTANENIAMISDLFAFLVLATYAVSAVSA